MSAFESAYPSLLQGVSQQIARERLPGQVTAQTNMLSDIVTGLRRRPGAEVVMTKAMVGDSNSIKSFYTDIAGERIRVIVNTTDGMVHIFSENHTFITTLDGSAYLTAADRTKIGGAVVGDELFLLNMEHMPSETIPTGVIDPKYRGWFYPTAGAYSKAYSVTVSTNLLTKTYTYTTPNGATAGDAAKAAPDYIATQLRDLINADVATLGLAKAVRLDAYVYLEANQTTATTLTVSTSVGPAFMIASRDAYTQTEGNLPAQLPSDANGLIMRVGSIDTPTYYQYVHASLAWRECGVFGSSSAITNMPISLTKVAGTWTLLSTSFEGRNAGNALSNETPRFVTQGITGIAAYQGRLVLLSGPMCHMSASNKPRRFYRSTVTSIIDSDPIHVGASANSSAAYRYAVPFQKDLILFSENYQALVPSGNIAITPRTATVVLTSTHAGDMSSSPVTLGRTLMYPMPRSADFFGVLEMIPSQYTDSQYVSNDATQHIPKYLGGRCRFSVSSSVANMALFAPSSDENSLIVHEYAWDGDKKVQQAWHTWTFPYAVADAYFSGNVVNLLFIRNGMLIGATIDPRVGTLTFSSERRPFLDLYTSVTYTDRDVTLPAWLVQFEPQAADLVQLCVSTGDLAGDLIGYTKVDANSIQTVRSFPSGTATIGFGYVSAFSPTPPLVRDFNEVVIQADRLTLLRYIIGTVNSSEFKVSVTDVNSDGPGLIDVGTLFWSSQELALGRSRYANTALSIVPCRTHAPTTVMNVYSSGPGELNITGMEYVCHYSQQLKRR